MIFNNTKKFQNMRKILLTVLILFISRTVFPQWSINNTVNNPVVTAPNNQLNARTVSDGDGGVIIVWEDYRTSTSNRDVYAQRFDKFGVKQWGDSNGIALGIKSVNERYPDLCTDGKGGAIFMWDDNPTSTVTNIKAQRITKNGVKLWSDTGITVASEGFRQSQPRVIYDNFGGCFYVYLTSEHSSTDYDIKANRLDSNGQKLWGNGIWVCQAEGLASDVVAAISQDNGFLIAWVDPRTSLTTEFDIYCQKLSPTGTPLWTINGIPVCKERFTQQYPDIYPDAYGGAFITWNDKRDSIQYDLFAQRIRPNGSIAGPNNGISICSAPTDQYRPIMTRDMKTGVIITWYDFRNGPVSPFNIDIYAQRLDSACNIKWASNGIIVCDAQYSQINQSIISDGNYGAIIAWDDRRAGTSIYDIYAQRIDSSGNLLWDTADVALSIAAGNQYKPKLSATTNGVIAVFEDTRNGSNNYDLFLQRVFNNGSLVTYTGKPSEKYTFNYSLGQNYPNPFNPSTNISFSIPKNDYVKLSIYDILGREVSVLVNEVLKQGSYEVRWNASGFSGGIYFYKLNAGDFSETRKMILIK